jgi:hypothetical protein
MKKIYLSIAAALAISTAATAQCGGRYDVDQFGVTATTGITYGSNVNSSNNGTTTLTLDFYEPTGDVSTARPLIIWAHGGSFTSGSSTDADVDTLCHRFAKKGYACASINYRLGVTSFDSLGFIPALVRSVQDMKAAVRFFYKDRSTGGANTYKIDTNNIFIGGSSAGSFTALHYAYLKRSCQVTSYISQHELDSLGGLSGYSGNQCYSENVKGVIDLCGALGTYGWLEAGDLPLCSMHGNADGTVNYSRGEVLPSFGIHILFADGSRMLKAQASAVGVSDNFYTWYGANHVPYAYSTTAGATAQAQELAYMDTTVDFVHDYLLQRLGYSCTASRPANTPYGTANLYAFTNCTTNSPLSCSATGIKSINVNLVQEVYPNPSENEIKVVFANSDDTHTVQVTDLSGRIVKSAVTTQGVYTLEKSNLTPGVYFLKVSNKQGETSTQKIIFY